MNCNHATVKGNTTKYFWCSAKEKSISEYECKDCLLKIPGARIDIIENLFGSLRNGHK